MTRIAWVLYGSLDQRTGGTIYDARIVAGLLARGDAVEVISIEPGTYAASSASLVRQLTRSRPEVVVGDELCFRELAFVFPRIAFTRRVLLVHHLTCWEEELTLMARRRARLPEAIALREADAVVATSRATRDRLILEGHRRPIDVVWPGADRLEVLARVGPPEGGGARLLFMGSVIARKRVSELVDAFASAHEGSTLRLAGSRDRDPAYVREVERAIAERGLGGRVTFLGEIDEGALARELSSADALVMPSSLEGFGIASTEAVTAGTPVIAARTPGLEEALSGCPEAVVFATSATLGEELRRFTHDAVLRREMQSAAARARLPTWQMAVDTFATAACVRSSAPA